MTLEFAESHGTVDISGRAAMVNTEIYNDHEFEGQVSLKNITSKVSGVFKGNVGLGPVLKKEFNFPLDLQGEVGIGGDSTFAGIFTLRGYLEGMDIKFGKNVTVTGLKDGGGHSLKLTNVTILDNVDFSAFNTVNNSDEGYRNCTIGMSGTQPTCLSKFNEFELH